MNQMSGLFTSRSAASNSKNVSKKKNQNIQVVVRVRPFNAKEKKSGAFNIVEVVPERKEVLVKDKLLPMYPSKSFTFDKVFGAQSQQIELYKSVVLPILNEVLEGYNCTIFAYGQTGTGKTFTMEGDRSEDPSISWEDDPLAGIIPRVMNQLFTELHERGNDFTVYVSFLEIYNEELIDLLGSDSAENPKLNIYEDSSKKGACIISGLTELAVVDKDEVYQILQQGAARRRTAATLMNAHSSRSHTLFMVTIKVKENSLKEFIKIGKFNLVDLAGSECIGKSGAHDKAAKEAGNINQSLLTLGRVITALVEHKSHVPYRESKLTRLLQDSLGGRTKTSIIATISPASSNLEETLGTLDYAFRARNITNKPEINQKLSEEALVKEYAEEVLKLHRDLKAARDKNGIYLDDESYNEMVCELKDLKERNGVLMHEFTELNETHSETKLNLKTTSDKLSAVTVDLERNEKELMEKKKELEAIKYKHKELEYISSCDLKVHNQLSNQAQEVLNNANDAELDTEGLHSKLNRMKSVENSNEPIKLRFKSGFEQWVAKLRSDLEGTNKEQEGFVNSMHELLDVSVEKIKNVTSEKLSILVQDVQKDLASFELAFKRHEHGMNKTNDQIQTSMATMTKDDEERIFSFGESIDLMICKMNVAIHSALSGFDKLKEQLNQQKIAELSCFDEMTSKMMSSIQKFISQTETLNRGQQEVSHKMKKLNDQKKVLRKEFEEYMAQIMRNSESMVEMDGQMEELAEEGDTMMDEVFKQCKSLGQSSLDETANDKIRFYSLSATHLHENVTTIDEVSVSVVDSNCVKDAQETVTMFCGRSVESLKNLSERVEECVTTSKTQLDEATSGFYSKSKDLRELVEDGVDEICEDQSEKSNELESMMRDGQKKLKDNFNIVRSWEEGCTNNLETMMQQVNTFVDLELLKDVSTGSTPKKKTREYPNELARKRKLNEMRAEFKTKFYANEAWNLPIPMDDGDGDDDVDLHQSLESIASSEVSLQSSSSSQAIKNKENVILPATNVKKEIKRPRVESLLKHRFGSNR